MTFWQFLDRRWPSERTQVVLMLAVLIGSLLKMVDHNPELWNVELFKTLLTASIITGALNMVLAFHFAANKSDEDKTRNTARAFDAIEATARANGTDAAVANAAEETADAAKNKAAEFSDATLTRNGWLPPAPSTPPPPPLKD